MNVPIFQSDQPFADGLSASPNPKPPATDKASFGRLASLYTAFSRDFASHVLNLCIRAGYTTICDPFCGTGTLAEAGRTLPISLNLSDISPFAAMSGAFRASDQATISQSIRLVEGLVGEINANDEQAVFSQLFRSMGAGTTSEAKAMFSAPSQPEFRVAALAIYICALARIRLHKQLTGSNPTWVKRSGTAADLDSTRSALSDTLAAVRVYNAQLPDLNPGNRGNSIWASISDEPYSPGSIDAIITSPPYANRTDYVRHYLPASELLLSASGTDERAIRSEQIGTPLIRGESVALTLPPSVMTTLEQIRTHHSYASERYYYKGFRSYFADMADALRRMKLWLRPGGMLLMVLQDTYYKEIYVPTADLLVVLARAEGFTLLGRQDWRVRQHLSRLSPQSMKAVPNRLLSESAIAFSR